MTVHSSSIPQRARLWCPSVNGPSGAVYPDSSFDVAAVAAVPGTNTLTATYTGPAFTNVPMTATDTSTVVLGDTAYTHDANGNLTGDATFLYQYDLANQLTNVVRKADNTTVLQCRYDALGRRVEAIRSDGTVDRYVYFPGSFLVLAVLDGSNNPKEFYTRGPDLSGTLDFAGGIGGILACTYSSSPSSTLFHHADLMGNIIALSDSSATLTSTFRYTPFGQFIASTTNSIPRYRFSSKELDADVNLIYYGYRYFVGYVGKWMTRDPYTEQGDINLYRFCSNSALANIDPHGLMQRVKKLDDQREKQTSKTQQAPETAFSEDCTLWFGGNQSTLGPNAPSGNNWGNGIPPTATAECHGNADCSLKTCGNVKVVPKNVEIDGVSTCCEQIMVCKIKSIVISPTGEKAGHNQRHAVVTFECEALSGKKKCGTTQQWELSWYQYKEEYCSPDAFFASPKTPDDKPFISTIGTMYFFEVKTYKYFVTSNHFPRLFEKMLQENGLPRKRLWVLCPYGIVRIMPSFTANIVAMGN